MPNKRAEDVHVHNIPVADALWDAVKTKATTEGLSIAEVVRRGFRQFLATPKAPQPAPPAPRTPFSERKPYTVADNLDDLQGPTTGVITLPHTIDWSGTPQKDLDIPGMLPSIYETILNEASQVAHLNALLNRDELIRLWPDLYLPAKVRRLWQERFPQLAHPHP